MSDFLPNNRHLRGIENSKKFTEVLPQVKQRAVMGLVALKTAISILTTLRRGRPKTL